jgi:hypothetical protein
MTVEEIPDDVTNLLTEEQKRQAAEWGISEEKYYKYQVAPPDRPFTEEETAESMDILWRAGVLLKYDEHGDPQPYRPDADK